MRYIFGILPAMRQVLWGKHLVLLSDFDGTLARIAPRPQDAFMDQGVRTVLDRIAHIPSIHLGIISGRPLSEVKQLVGIPDISYAGIHGWEWSENGISRRVRLRAREKNVLDRVSRAFQALVHKYPKLIVENKRSAVAVHYRQIPAKDRQHVINDISEIVAEAANTVPLNVKRGKQVTEITLRKNPTKWDSVVKFRNLAESASDLKVKVLYLGDDTTDEDVFRHLNRGIGIRVGYKQSSHAQFYVRNVSEVRRLLEWLEEVALQSVSASQR